MKVAFPNLTQKELDKKLQEYISKNDLPNVKAAINAGADVNTKFGVIPLNLATLNNNFEMVELLLKNGADVNARNPDGITALHDAVRYGNKDIVKLLLEKGADNIADEHAQTPLDDASRYGHKDIVKLIKNTMLSRFDNPTFSNYTQNELNEKLLEYVRADDLPMVKAAINAGADVNTEDRLGNTPLHIASYKGNLLIVKVLLDEGAKTSLNWEGLSPLHIASLNGYLEIVKLLLKKGTNVDEITTNKKTALHYAAQMGHKDIVELLLENGADVYIEDKWGHNALYFASDYRHDDIVKLIKLKMLSRFGNPIIRV